MINESFQQFLTEIRAESVIHDEDSVKSVINGQRDCCFLVMSTQRIIDPRPSIQALSEAINHGLNLLPVRNRKDGVAFVVYRRNERLAKELVEYAERRKGYLSDETAEEARYVGGLLSYDAADIEKYVEKKYPNS
jgi:hypothetical protein